MKKNLPFIALPTLFILLTVLSCGKKITSPLNYDKTVMILGSGGGFTGAMSQYYLLDNGQIFRSGNTDTTFIEVGKLTAENVDQWFTSYKALHFEKTVLDEPGNRYYFIIRKEDGKEHKLQWGYQELQNKSPEIFHKNFMNLVKKLESSTTTNSSQK